jgi:UPF0716 protein FxsA
MPIMPLRFLVLAYLFAEIAGFIVVGKMLGVLPTLGLILLGIVAGTLLLRRQGLATLRKAQSEVRAGRQPARVLADGAVQAVAALLLIVPGFLSDLVAFALLVPPVRNAGWRLLRSRVPRWRAASAPRRPGVVDLEAGEYAHRQRPANAETPWRPPEIPGR